GAGRNDEFHRARRLPRRLSGRLGKTQRHRSQREQFPRLFHGYFPLPIPSPAIVLAVTSESDEIRTCTLATARHTDRYRNILLYITRIFFPLGQSKPAAKDRSYGKIRCCGANVRLNKVFPA